MEEPKSNKNFVPKGNKQVKIRFFDGRAAEGVKIEADGTAMVDAETAQYLVGIGYANYLEKENEHV